MTGVGLLGSSGLGRALPLRRARQRAKSATATSAVTPSTARKREKESDRSVPNVRWTHNRSRPMKRLALALCLAALAAPALDAQVAPAPAPAPAATSARRRVAVLDFDYATVHSSVTGVYGSDVDVGKGVATVLVSELVRNGTYTVMERAEVDRILSEQNFQQGARADASTAAKLGRLLGVDAIIIGSITQFQREDKNINLGLR